jgi:hypothetical protein
MNFRIASFRFLFALPVILLFGCEDVLHPDLVRTGAVKAQAGDSTLVDLSLPKVVRMDDQLVISGTVTRKPGIDQSIPNGYLLIEFLTSAGDEIDEIWAAWTPSEIPTGGSRQSTYEVHYLWLPPPNTTVRVVYGPTEEAQDLCGSGRKGGTTGGLTHAPPASAHHYNGGGGNLFNNGLGFHH